MISLCAAIWFCVHSMSLYAQSFEIKGQVTGVKDGTRVKLVKAEDGRKDSLAGATFRGGKFVLKGKVASPALCEIQIESLENEGDGKSYKSSRDAKLMLDNVKMSYYAPHLDSIPSFMHGITKEKNVVIKGGEVQQEYQQYRDYMYPSELEVYHAWRELYWSSSHKRKSAEEEERGKAVLEAAEAKVREQQQLFVTAHPTYAISAFLVSQWVTEAFAYTAEELDALYASLTPGKDKARLAQVKTTIDATKRYLRGSTYTDLNMLTVDKKETTLKDNLDSKKYNLIDFWASWCGPCRAAIPNVRKLYKAHSANLNVLAISVDAKEGDWYKAMEEEKMEWKQLWIPKELVKAVQENYRLQSIPFLLLIDPQGHIVYAGHNINEIQAILKDSLN